MQGSVRLLNPQGLHENPGSSQAAVVAGNVRTMDVGGQNAVDASGAIVGEGDIRAQTEQLSRKVELALAGTGRAAGRREVESLHRRRPAVPGGVRRSSVPGVIGPTAARNGAVRRRASPSRLPSGI
jgi:hypothetical protein